jgi:hypothetical protein
MTSKLLLIVSTAAFALIGCAGNKAAAPNTTPENGLAKITATKDLSEGNQEAKKGIKDFQKRAAALQEKDVAAVMAMGSPSQDLQTALVSAENEGRALMAKTLESKMKVLVEQTRSQIGPQAAQAVGQATEAVTVKLLKNVSIQDSDYDEGTFPVGSSTISGYRYRVLVVMNPKSFAQAVENEVKNKDVKVAAQLHDVFMGKLEAATQAFEADKAKAAE